MHTSLCTYHDAYKLMTCSATAFPVKNFEQSREDDNELIETQKELIHYLRMYNHNKKMWLWKNGSVSTSRHADIHVVMRPSMHAVGQTNIHLHRDMRACAHTHARTHTHANTHMHTQKHTHIY